MPLSIKLEAAVMSTQYQYFRKPPDLDRELEHLIELVQKEAASDLCTTNVSARSQMINSTAQVHVVTYVDRGVEPVIQNGPMCGLVALTMAHAMLGGYQYKGAGDKAHPEVLLREVKERGVSKNGEIFAVEFLEDIARDHLLCQAEVVDLVSLDILEVVLQGKALLVPYDADKDHTPCLEKGHKAHWCLVVGVAIILPSTLDNTLDILQYCTPTVSLPGHFPIREDKRASFLANKRLMLGSSAQQLYVFARHGKSAHLGLWKFTNLLESNKNLVEVDHKRTRPGEYVIPEGGIKRGLCERALLVSKGPAQTI